MRTWSLFVKEMTETFRDWKMLSMTLTFAPFFVLLMYAYLGHNSPVYQVAVVNADAGAEAGTGADPGIDPGAPALEREPLSAGDELVAALRELRTPEGEAVLRVRVVEEADAETLLQDRRVDVVLLVPEAFSRILMGYRRGLSGERLPVRSRGDPANPDYLMAAVWVDMVTLEYVESALGLESPLALEPETITSVDSLSDFDLYVPALLALSLMMLMFTAAGALIREKDKGTLIRLRLSNLTALEWLTAVSLTQVIVGTLALALTYLTALSVGYRPPGSPLLLLLVGALTSLSIMAFSVLVAAFLRTVFDLVTVGCFPFFILMFFSGGMFPLPSATLFHVGERAVALNEILPTTHAITAMQKVLSYDAGLGGIAYELGALLLLTILLYTLGAWIFTRRHMPAVG